MQRCAIVLVCLAWICGPAAAEDLKHTYLKPGELRLERVLPPPPALNSAEAKADLAAVEAAVLSRTAADTKRIEAQKPCDAGAFANGILGPRFTRERASRTFALVENAFEDAELAVLDAKRRFGRPRPYTLDPELATLGHRSETSSYPSGHASCGRVMAVILANLVPDRATALFARGDLYGRNRLLAGTHFPSDLVAGATAGSVIADALFRNARFQADFAGALIEMQEVLR